MQAPQQKYQIRVKSANFTKTNARARARAYNIQTIFRYIVECMRTFGNMTEIETLIAPTPYGTTHQLVITYDKLFATTEGNTLLYSMTNYTQLCYEINPREYTDSPDNVPEYDEIVIQPIPIFTTKG